MYKYNKGMLSGLHLFKKYGFLLAKCYKVTYALCILLVLVHVRCVPRVTTYASNPPIAIQGKTFGSADTNTVANLSWKKFFKDTLLQALIDTALRNNQEMQVLLQEIQIAKNEIKVRKGVYLPFVNYGLGVGMDKAGRYSRFGALDNTLQINNQAIPDPYREQSVYVNMTWEIDVWKKLRNAKKSAIMKYLATVEGRHFMVTHLVSEVANVYYELIALDNQLEIVKATIEIQKNALEIIKLEKAAARTTELAVKRFEAEVLKNQSKQYYIQQAIATAENKMGFLLGKKPERIVRNATQFIESTLDSISVGVPAQLLLHRPDIRKAERMLLASEFDVKTAKAFFYPVPVISAGLGTQALNPAWILQMPESALYYLAGQLLGPLINRNEIKAMYLTANARQKQAMYTYERAVLLAYIEVATQLANIQNLKESFEYKERQVAALTQSIDISTSLFRSARADYMEVLLTQRDALDAKIELVEIKNSQMNALINVYKAAGGGWR